MARDFIKNSDIYEKTNIIKESTKSIDKPLLTML
jgi:hypothetical protein